MKRLLLTRKNAAPCGARRGAGWAGRLAGGVLLALLPGLFVGMGQAWAAPRLPAASPTLSFTQPNYRGLIGGPPGTRVTVKGYSWLAYADVSLSLTPDPGSCGAVPVKTYQTNGNGSFIAAFNWPLAANAQVPYYACATQANKGTAVSRNTFTVLASSPASLSFSLSNVTAGSNVTVIGSNWLPGSQTITVVILPCKTVCQAQPVANTEVVSSSNGTFSQPMTILADAATGTYYAQASNTQATLSAVSAPIHVAGQTAPGGTPVPGSRPTTSATRTTPGVGAAQPPSQAPAALKDALLAAALGLVVLLLLLGAVTFTIGRRHDAEPAAAKVGKDEGLEHVPPTPAGRAAWRAPGLAIPEAQEKHQAPDWLLSRRGGQEMAERTEKDTLHLSPPARPTASASGDNYPWEQPTAPGAHPRTQTGRPSPQLPTLEPTTGSGQRTSPPQPPIDKQEG